MASNFIRLPASAGGAGVSSLNTLTGAVVLAQGTKITLSTVGNTITISASGGGGGISGPGTTTATDIVTWNSSNGTVVADSTLQIDASSNLLFKTDGTGCTCFTTGYKNRTGSKL